MLFRNVTWIQGTLLLQERTEWALLIFSLTYSCSLNGYSQSVKMWHCCPIYKSCIKLPFVTPFVTVNGGNESQHGSNLTISSALWLSPPRHSWATCWRLVAKQKWKTLICITATQNYSKQKFLSVCASLRGLPLFQKSPCTHGLQITETSESHSHFLTALPLLITLSSSQSLFWLFLRVKPLKSVQVTRWRKT